MKKWIAGLLALVLSLSLSAQEQKDPYPELGAKLEEYFTALSGESAAMQSKECDFLIDSCKDSLVRQYVALKIYDHYLKSRIMGDDAVAVHIADKWLLSGEIPMPSGGDLVNVQLFASFNRASLIGSKAPELQLFGPDGSAVSVPAKEGYSVLYFYDTGCSTCKVETGRLARLKEAGEYPFTLYAVYVGADKASWETYRSALPDAVHAWDPDITSDWQRKYGVLKTPKIFLVSPEGIILGRGLDTPALNILLNREFSKQQYVYGEPGQMERYRQLFAAYGDTLKVSDVLDVADYLAARTFGEGDMDSFKQVTGDLLYYLSSSKTEVYRDACAPFIDKYIHQLPDVWNTEDDKARIVSLGEMLSELTARTPVGLPLPDIEVFATRRRKPCLLQNGTKTGFFRLSAFKGKPGFLVFYSKGCSSCQETLDAVERIVKENRKARVLLVDMDALLSDYPKAAGELLDSFDLSAMPLVVEVDKKRIVRHRYVDLTKIH